MFGKSIGGSSACSAVDVKTASNFPSSLDPMQVGVAFSKRFTASISDLVVFFSRSPAHKHYSLSDIEWMVIPLVSARQFYVVGAVDRKRDFLAPVAAMAWAFVSEDVDQLLQQQVGPLPRLRPDQWSGGTTGWLIDAVGDAAGVRMALQWLAAGPFKEQNLSEFTISREVEA